MRTQAIALPCRSAKPAPHRRTRKQNAQAARPGRLRGFTVVEALVVLLILLGGILVLTRFQGTQINVGAQNRQRTEAVFLAQQTIESLRAFSVVATTAGADAYADIVSGTDSVKGLAATYARTWTVTDKGTPAYKTVEVSVTWQDARGKNETVTLTTYVSAADPALAGRAITGT